jgi:glycosyltransferase involved in cell wall biosynthesis
LLKLLWFCLKSNVLLSLLQLRRPYDVVHVHNIPDFLVASAWLPKVMGARVLLDIHDVVPELYAGKFGNERRSIGFRLLLRVERLCCGFADHVIVANHLWQAKLISRSVTPQKCTTIMNYPDLELFKPARESPAKGRPFVLLYPGTLNLHQGLDIAIEAFARIHRQMPGAEFHIYGKGPALAQLVRLAVDAGVANAVKFNDPIDVKEIAGVIASASAGIVPKRSDGFGNEAFSTKTLEFMACSVPLIVARTKIDDYYFSDSLVNFFTPGDTSDLARVLLDVYSHPEDQAARVRAAAAFASDFSWQQRYIDYRSLVDSLAICQQTATA